MYKSLYKHESEVEVPYRLFYINRSLKQQNGGEYTSGTLHGQNPVTYEVINPEDFMGACNLGSLFLHNFVRNPFTKNSYIDYDLLSNATHNAVRFLDNIIDINKFPTKSYENYQKNIRTIGIGITGLANLLVMMNTKYGSDESVKITDELMNFIAKESYRASIDLAKEKGAFPFLDRNKYIQSGYIQKHISKDKEWLTIANDIAKYGIRNGRIISVAPTGTLSLTFGNNCSSGLEPIFSLQYDRKVKMGGQDESNIKIVKMEDYSYKLWKETIKDNIVTEDKFVTAMNLTVDDHLRILKTVAFHVDMSCSKTINIPTDYPFEDTKRVYDFCWENGIKGCTIFRPNPIRQGILISPEAKQEEVKPEDKELKRGEWQEVAEDTEYYRRKIYIGCGKLSLFIGYSHSLKSIQDLYVVRSGHGGCERNLQGMVIAMSGMLRLGGNIFNIEKAFDGVGVCPSFISQRVKGEKVSSGSSCGIAILTEIKKFLKEIEKEQQTPNVSKPIHTETEEVKSKLTNEEREFIKINGEIAFANKYHKCPVCGTVMVNAEGCVFCGECGWSKCS